MKKFGQEMKSSAIKQHTETLLRRSISHVIIFSLRSYDLKVNSFKIITPKNQMPVLCHILDRDIFFKSNVTYECFITKRKRNQRVIMNE